jgi:hypothetical protein
MIFNWFDAKKEINFGHQLADFYIARAAKNQHEIRGKVVERKQRELLSKLSLQIDQFKSTQSLNFYKKAQMGNAFKWRLLDAGLDSAHADELTSWVTRQI